MASRGRSRTVPQARGGAGGGVFGELVGESKGSLAIPVPRRLTQEDSEY